MAGGVRPKPAKTAAKFLSRNLPNHEGSSPGGFQRRLAKALEQHAAITEILSVMSASPSDIKPVLNVVAERAAHLCDAPFARVMLAYGDMLRAAAEYSLDGTPHVGTVPLALKRTTLTGRAVLDRATIHHEDIVPLLDTDYPDALNARRLGLRAVLAMPLIREGKAFGAITLWRREPRPFSREQIALVQTFAQQAAIAVDNVRLFNETKEALEQQTATSEILRIISQSPTDVQPVFDAILKSGVRLCEAHLGLVLRYDVGMFRAVATLTPDRAFDAFMREPRRWSAKTGLGRIERTRQAVNIPDLLDDDAYRERDPGRMTSLKLGGVRSWLGVPMLREGELIGAILVYRKELRPFGDRQVALLQTFADQAVIAIENVRLFNETKEALEQQTATSEILKVISQSPTDVQPVFDAIALAAQRLCEATSANLFTFDGRLVHLASHARSDLQEAEAQDLLALQTNFPRPPGLDLAAPRAVLTCNVVSIPDVLADAEYKYKEAAVAGGFRSILAVPLTRDGTAMGTIVVGRPEPGPFPDKQIALLQTFADQAVIAIENVRLFDKVQTHARELSDSLQQQTATADVLKVISRSAFDLETVLDTLTESVCKLCEAETSNIWRSDGDAFKVAAMFGPSQTHKEAVKQLVIRPGRDTCAGRALLEGKTVHIPDAKADPEYNVPNVLAAAGNRAMLGVPLLRESAPIGVLVLTRSVARPFTEKQIALATTFADQAVIAIENVRLFNETKEALEQQTATSEILRVISQSPRNVQPVFDTISDAALRLCSASSAIVTTFDGEFVKLCALANVDPERAKAVNKSFPVRPGSAHASSRAVLSCSVVSIPDVLDDPDYAVKANAVAGGFRSALAVPMIRDGKPIGTITVGRPEPGPLPAKQIALLQTFASQAVIAIENVRLFTELETRTTELGRSVGELKALGEVGQAVSSTLDLETVLNTIVARATQLAGVDGGSIFEYEEAREEFNLRATDRLPDELVAVLRAAPIQKGEGALGRLAITREAVEIRDIADDRSYQSRAREILIRYGYRSVLAVPLLREDHLLGALAVNRNSAGEFAPDVIDLLKTFATQSALAIQNARLYRELERKSRQLEVASRHKSEFLANMSHELRTPLNAIIGFSEILSQRMFGDVNDKQAEYLADILESGQHLLSLINDILDLSKIEAGRMELDETEFDLRTAIENTLILVRERAQRHGITLRRTLDERIGTIRGDERKVKQVLLNLLSNALKFTPEGGQIDVHADVHDGAVEISVRDTGVGIAPEDQEAVFEEFRQVGVASKKVEGTGLGLAISRKFIELHGGRIWVDSQPGVGSTFTFTLPIRPAREDR